MSATRSWREIDTEQKVGIFSMILKGKSLIVLVFQSGFLYLIGGIDSAANTPILGARVTIGHRFQAIVFALVGAFQLVEAYPLPAALTPFADESSLLASLKIEGN